MAASETGRTYNECVRGFRVPAHNPVSPYSVPPGFLGEIAQYFYAQAPRPVPEIALAGAIGLIAGICGRAYNVSNPPAGLNLYTLLLAPTGTGKEAIASGVTALMKAIRQAIPASAEFIGPASIASPQALVKHLANTSPSFVSILGEFGLTMQQMANFAQVFTVTAKRTRRRFRRLRCQSSVNRRPKASTKVLANAL